MLAASSLCSSQMDALRILPAISSERCRLHPSCFPHTSLWSICSAILTIICRLGVRGSRRLVVLSLHALLVCPFRLHTVRRGCYWRAGTWRGRPSSWPWVYHRHGCCCWNPLFGPALTPFSTSNPPWCPTETAAKQSLISLLAPYLPLYNHLPSDSMLKNPPKFTNLKTSRFQIP